jgi:hypothetical protein
VVAEIQATTQNGPHHCGHNAALSRGPQAIGKAKEINPQAFDSKALSDVNLNK